MSSDVGMVLVIQHAVPEFDAWYEQYKCIKADAAKKMENELGIAKTIINRLHEPNADGRPVVQALHFFTADKLEAVRKQFTFTGPPFVGGLDLIKKGFVIEPIKSYYATVASTVTYNQLVDAQEPLSMCVGSCGIPDWEDWYKMFMKMQEFSQSLGHISSVVGRRVDKHENGKDQCFVAHTFPTARVEDMKKTMQYDGPPFVGGEDLFKNGMLFPPMDFHLYHLIGQSYQLAETKTVLLPPTKVD